jgi:hypothetical protein
MKPHQRLALSSVKSSTLKKLLYLVKRARPDLLTVSFLTTRFQVPTVQDWSKLERAIRYIRSTKVLGIRQEAGKMLTKIAYVEASFVAQPNAVASGIVVTL